jgi:tetratricopeptide (TPR) repeat protein
MVSLFIIIVSTVYSKATARNELFAPQSIESIDTLSIPINNENTFYIIDYRTVQIRTWPDFFNTYFPDDENEESLISIQESFCNSVFEKMKKMNEQVSDDYLTDTSYSFFGICSFFTGDLDGAIDNFEKALDVGCYQPSACYFNLATVYRVAGDFDNMMKNYEMMQDSPWVDLPKTPPTSSMQGILQFSMDMLVGMNLFHPEFCYLDDVLLGDYYFEIADYTQAMEHYEAAIETMNKYALVEGRFEDALEDWQASEQYPILNQTLISIIDWRHVQLQLAASYYYSGRYEDAISAVNDVLEYIETDSELEWLARIHIAQRNIDGAVHSCNYYLDNATFEINSPISDAVVLLCDEIIDKEEFPDEFHYDELASEAFDNGECSEAIKYYNAASFIDPSNADFVYNLAVSYQECDNDDFSLQAFYKYLNLQPDSEDEDDVLSSIADIREHKSHILK